MLPLSGGELMTLRRGTVVEIRMEVPAHTTESNFYIPARGRNQHQQSKVMAGSMAVGVWQQP